MICNKCFGKNRAVDLRPKEAVEESSGLGLKKDLTLWNGIGIIVGGTVGTGIFITPPGVLRYSGSVGLSLLVWLFTGIMSAIGAHCYTELGTTLPKSGGIYIYLLEAYGELAAFLFIWSNSVILGPVTLFVMALTFSGYVLQPLFSNCESIPTDAAKLITALLIGFVTWLNYRSTKWAVTVQNFLTFSKILPLLIIGVSGVCYLVGGHTENYQDPFLGSNWSLISLATAYYQCSFTYGGWNNLNFLTEELKNPKRDVPRAIWTSLFLITSIYCLVNVAYFALLSPGEMLVSSAVAVSFGSKIYGGLDWLISLLVAASSFGSFLSEFITLSRVNFSAAREGHLPQFLALVNLNKLNPMASVLTTGVVCASMLVFSDVYSVLNYLGLTGAIFLWLSIAALLRLRYTRPELPRPVKVWTGFPIIYLLFGSVTIILPIFNDPFGLGMTLLVILFGVPVYYLCLKWPRSKSRLSHVSGKITRYAQILLMSCPETLNDEANSPN